MSETSVAEEVVETPPPPPQDARLLESRLGAAFLGHRHKFEEDLYLLVEPDAVVAALRTLRDEGQYDYFVECLGVDYSTWDHARDLSGRFEVVYNLYSTSRNARVFMKTSVDDGTSIPTAKGLYIGAEFPEKEIADLFGVHFSGNELAPGTRFLLPDDWEGFPLRKEVPLGGEDVVFDKGYMGPAVEDVQMPHAGESFEGRTGSEDISGR